MVAKQPTPAMALILEQLRADPHASYASVRKHAEARGMKIYPIMYGRALALLGLVEVAPRGSKKRQLQQPLGSAAIEHMVKAVREAEDERARYKAALQTIAKTLRQVLESNNNEA